MDFYGFYTGQEFEAYKYLGAHYTKERTTFRTFAPSAAGVELVLNGQGHGMQRVHDGNFYEITLDQVKEGDLYEFRIWHRDGSCQEHCDPYGFGMELRPAHKSVVRDLNRYAFTDEKWLKDREDISTKPLNIYEVHAGSFKKPGTGQTDWYTYEELGEVLIPYLKESGYNCVEFLPLSEHPCDESWGYQNTGFFAPTARYGTAEGLQKMHQNGIYVLLDFVPVHFATDDYGLKRYDGGELYEYPSRDVGVSEWGSCNFMHSRGEVRCFLQSAAYYWMKEFHFDGIRMDAISRIIYWQGDERRGVNGNAVDFIRFMNKGLKERVPNCILAAEDSTNFPGVTAPTDQGGLGFDLKWNMGWMHDTLEYFQLDPSARTDAYHKLTFSMMYAYNEHYLLPLSHDEVVHGKATILQKMNGDYERKFPQARAMYAYMMLHPGKKLNFMGNEIGQFREWDEKREQDWNLLDFPIHEAFYHYMKELNHLYLDHPALWEKDFNRDGFTWLDCHQEGRVIYAMQRMAGDQTVIGVFNFSAQPQNGYAVPLQKDGSYRELLNSDWECFGGSKKREEPVYENGCVLDLSPFSAVLLVNG